MFGRLIISMNSKTTILHSIDYLDKEARSCPVDFLPIKQEMIFAAF